MHAIQSLVVQTVQERGDPPHFDGLCARGFGRPTAPAAPDQLVEPDLQRVRDPNEHRDGRREHAPLGARDGFDGDVGPLSQLRLRETSGDTGAADGVTERRVGRLGSRHGPVSRLRGPHDRT